MKNTKLYLVNRESVRHGNWSSIYRKLNLALDARNSNSENKLYEFELKCEIK